MELYTDTYYVHRIKRGENEYFACLLDKYSDRVFALIVKIIRNREDAEELTQDVFMKVFRGLFSFKEESNFSSWLYRIAYNTAISYTRHKKVEFLAVEDTQISNVSEEQVANMLGYIEQTERVSLLEKALEQLLPEERGLILFYYMENKSVEELVQITGFSSSNIKTKLFRIRKKLYVLIKAMERAVV
ncbi:MAG: RNA polymerase sigma factor [Tannerellaceae bacterium]|nr:RNA polymerase sigma factor [Tannerellaceae bacterium]